MDINAMAWIGIGIIIILVVLFLLDLFLAGGAGSMGMMHGTAMMMSNPIGQAILLVLLIILGVLVYGVFFR
ncbi:MAG TPA: hypothetical protein VI753_14390 [Anaerolineales bacterium]|nr:hypothetical protein [Anaerolineales bacterium]